MLDTGASPEQIKPSYASEPHIYKHPPPPLAFLSPRLIRKPFESPSELPSISWWPERRGLGGIQSEAWAWARVAMADIIQQCVFEETQISGNGK